MRKSTSSFGQAELIPKLIPARVADRFLRILWQDVIHRRVVTQTHQQNLLRKNALEIHGRNYSPLLALHWGLTSIVAEKTGSDLLPSFSYFRLYFEGDICRVHSDRPACEVSISLTLAYSDGLPWDLGVAKRALTEDPGIRDDFGDKAYSSFAMMPGDAVLYYGSNHRHGRPTPNPNRWSAHLFFQWVEVDGEHEEEAFERLEEAFDLPRIGDLAV